MHRISEPAFATPKTLAGRQRSAVEPVVGVSFRAGDVLCPNGVRDLVRHAILAEALGFYDVDAPDHVLMTKSLDDHPGGKWLGRETMWADPIVVLSAIAAVTSHLRLTTSVWVLPLRPAAVAAKAAATLDNLCGGRLRLGVGAGWLRAEFNAVGLPYLGRTKRLEDSIGACRALWTQSPAYFDSETVTLDEVWCHPKPVHPGGIPVLIGGPPTPEVAHRIAKLGEGWNPEGSHRSRLAEGVGYIRSAVEDAGRDPDKLIIRCPAAEDVVRAAYRHRDAAALLTEIAELGKLGVTDVKIYASGVASSFEEVEDVMTWISKALRIERTPSP